MWEKREGARQHQGTVRCGSRSTYHAATLATCMTEAQHWTIAMLEDLYAQIRVRVIITTSCAKGGRVKVMRRREGVVEW